MAPLVVDTGKFTGRSVKDKFIVRDAETEDTIWWGKINQPMSPEHFAALKADFLAALKDRTSSTWPTCSAVRSPNTASTCA
jgi:phosphoenolpyruvate carboxykinase (ATP)